MQNITPIEGITPQSLWIAIGVLVGLATVALLFLNLIKAARDVKAPKEREGRTLEDKLDNDNRRIKTLQEEVASIVKTDNLLLKCQMVIIQHMITGDHVNDLQKTYEEIQTFLLER